ncbi:MAG: tetratricopeptide repeat protein [Actinomycetota bacterium]|nr:tetratricopeptide repeat protein [Actinomycetota bacterium]
MSNTHYWVRGGRRADRNAAIQTLGLPAEIVPTTDAHRRLRGPYTAAGTVARALVPAVLARRPDLVEGHEIELLSAAPELSAIVPNSKQTLTSMAIPKERTRFYARLRTRRIANGLVEFVRDALPEGQPAALVVENVEHAEQTDLEFLAALVRRVDPERLTIVICTGTNDVADDELMSALASRTQVTQVTPAVTTADAGTCDGDGEQLAWRYVATDGTSDDPRLRKAYQALEPADRARLHDRRAEELAALDQQSLRLGAIPYHLEHGSDPAGAGAQALYAAQDYCLCVGYYLAVVDYGYRGVGLVDPKRQESLWWMFAIELGLALSILSRTKEAEALYDQARLVSIKPTVHMAAAYSTAMLYTRHNDLADRDEHKAKAWLNSAIATASLIEDRSERAFQSAFYNNGRALVEVNLGEPTEALRLVDECIDSLDRDLSPDQHRLHRSVLKNNRARVYASLGRLDDALADYAVVIGEDPNHAEHYLERGNILRRLGRLDEAFADYATAIRLSPPFPEIYYNRGDLSVTVGNTDGALADFSYVLELDPDFVDAYVNRAGLYLEAGQVDRAHRDATDGLLRDPNNPYLLAVLGQVHAAGQEFADAKAAFDRALEADPALVAALSGRAAVAFEMGELDAALSDLDQAIGLKPSDAALRYNRAFAYQSTDRWDEALADLDVAVGLAPGDPDIVEAVETCRARAAVTA